MRKEELKPCPFCGSESELAGSSSGFRWVMCRECESRGPLVEPDNCSDEDCYAASSLWNTRAPQGEWVSIAQPPMADGFYLIFANYIVNSWVELLGFKEGQWIDIQNNIFPATITHWMPLPTPPKGV